MVWQRIDDQFGVSQKVIRIPRKRRQQCVGLWLLATNYSVRALTDGVLEAHELDELDARPTDIAELVRVGMWHGPQHSCGRCPRPPKGGVVVHDFLVYNKSRSQVEAEREKERVRKNVYGDLAVHLDDGPLDDNGRDLVGLRLAYLQAEEAARG